jgi:acyl carrier protein
MTSLLQFADRSDQRAMVAARIRDVVAAIVGRSPASMGLDVSLSEQGLDSLIASEIRVALEEALGYSVPVVRLLQGPTIDGLAASILDDPVWQ